uniref:Uncharacterized protein n=1 Tax=Mus musculus TaxID=10090 RepID=Q9D357_MOUSE|nr:unnamed protein product [Mus musculus]
MAALRGDGFARLRPARAHGTPGKKDKDTPVSNGREPRSPGPRRRVPTPHPSGHVKAGCRLRSCFSPATTGFQRLNSGCQAWYQAPLSTEPSCQAWFQFNILECTLCLRGLSQTVTANINNIRFPSLRRSI